MLLQLLRLFGSALLLLGFFYFIAIRAINTKNFKRKSLYIFIFGLVIFIFFLGGIIYDFANGIRISDLSLGYFAYPIVNILLLLSFVFYYYFKGRKFRQKFKSNYQKQASAPTIKDKKEFLYIILKHNGDFLLTKEEEKDEVFYKGIVMKFPHNEYFHDELIKQYIADNNLDVISYSQVGKATKRDKKDNIYFCYKILLNTIPNKNNDLVEIDSYKLVSANMSDFDKKILFTSVVENDFDILL